MAQADHGRWTTTGEADRPRPSAADDVCRRRAGARGAGAVRPPGRRAARTLPQAAPDALPALAHAVKGAARGIGAWRVARAAAVVEMAPRGDTGELAAALTEARAAIAAILQWH